VKVGTFHCQSTSIDQRRIAIRRPIATAAITAIAASANRMFHISSDSPLIKAVPASGTLFSVF